MRPAKSWLLLPLLAALLLAGAAGCCNCKPCPCPDDGQAEIGWFPGKWFVRTVSWPFRPHRHRR